MAVQRGIRWTKSFPREPAQNSEPQLVTDLIPTYRLAMVTLQDYLKDWMRKNQLIADWRAVKLENDKYVIRVSRLLTDVCMLSTSSFSYTDDMIVREGRDR